MTGSGRRTDVELLHICSDNIFLLSISFEMKLESTAITPSASAAAQKLLLIRSPTRFDGWRETC